MTTPFFSVIIVNYNGGEYLQLAVNSLAKQTFKDFEVWVVDNASADTSMELLDLSSLTNAQVVMVGRNSGFAEGNNIAAKRANGEWLVLLNADAIAADNWLETLRDSIARYPDYAMISSVQERIVEQGKLDGVGDCYSAFGFPWRGGFMWPVESVPDLGDCFSPCGASSAYKTSVFLEHGGFDESYFCFVEDVDLGFRMRLAGEKCLFNPQAVVQHKGGGLTQEKSEFSVYHGMRNLVWTYLGNMPLGLLLLTLPGHLLLSAYLCIRYVHQPYGRYVRNGLIAGWSSAWKKRQNRKTLRLEKKISSISLAGMMSWNILKMSSKSADVRKIS